MKKIKFSLLASLSILLIATFLVSCNKDKEDELDVVPNGNVVVPTTMDYSNIEVVSGTNTAEINEQGDFFIEPIGVVYAINKETEEIIYISVLPAKSTTNSKSTTEEVNIELSPLETAISIVYFGVGVTGYRPDMFSGATETFLEFKDFISSKETTQILADGIEDVIREYGELYFFALEDGLYIDAVSTVLDCAQDLWGAITEETELIFSYHGEQNQYSIFAPYLEYNSLSGFGDFKVEIDNAIWKNDIGKWELECTIYNGCPQYFVATSGYLDEETNKIIYDKTQISNLLLPYNTSAFYNEISSCDGFAKFITDTKNLYSYGFDGLQYSTRQFTKNTVKIKVNEENDLLVLFNPQASNHLKVLVLLQLGLNEMKTSAELFTAYLDILEEDTPKNKEKKKIIQEMFSEFITDILTDPQMQAYINDGVFEPTKENFGEISLYLLEEFFNYLKSNEAKFYDLVSKSDLNGQVDLDELISKEFALTKKLIDKTAKFTAATLDIIMASMQWEYAYNGFYFQLNFDEYYELFPLPGSENVNLSETSPSITFSDEIGFNSSFNCTIKGYGPAPQGSTDIFPLLPEHIVYITDLGKIVGVSFDYDEFVDGWDYEIEIEAGAITDKNGIAFPGIEEGNWTFSVSNSGGDTGTFTDPRDGQTYTTVEIGDQLWFAENLNYEMAGSYFYDDAPANGEIYGRLYTWDAALIACPSGWHLPSDEEWKTLEMELGMSQSEADSEGLRGTDEGEQMKSTSGWYLNGNGTNSSGFTALPGGFRDYYDGIFYNLARMGHFWSSTESSSWDAWTRGLRYGYDQVYRIDFSKTDACSVRCVKD